MIPALKATGRGAQASIQRASAGGSGIEFGRGYSVLIVGEVAVALWLLAIGSTAPTALSEPDGLGVSAARYLHASLRLPQVDATPRTPGDAGGRPVMVEQRASIQEELVRRLSAEPGLGPIAVANALPGTTHATRYIQVEGLPRAEDAPHQHISYESRGWTWAISVPRVRQHRLRLLAERLRHLVEQRRQPALVARIRRQVRRHNQLVLAVHRHLRVVALLGIPRCSSS